MDSDYGGGAASSLAKYWSDALVLLERAVTDVVFDTMIKTLIPVSFENNVFTLKTEQDFFKISIHKRHMPDITNSLRAVTDRDLEVRVLSPDDYVKRPSSIATPNHASLLRTKYKFDSFVRGKSNELAYAASLAVAEAPGQTTYNPLFLYGGVGLGKTHLMHSIGNHIMEHYPGTRVLYVSSETFTNEFVTSIKQRTNQEFRNKYRENDVLLIDDIQFLSEKEGTQEELFHTFNTLYNDSKQIVLTSDLPPKEIKTLEDRLRSRFASGLIVDITLPDFETRMAILEKKAELEHLIVPRAVNNFIAKNIVSNIRDLEGALIKVTAYAKLSNTPIDVEMADKALRDLISDKVKREISVQFIQEVVSEYYNLTVDDLKNRKRTASIVYPRQIAMYLSRKLTGLSLPQIGDFFGGRHHSTVIHGCELISEALENDANLSRIVMDLERKLREG